MLQRVQTLYLLGALILWVASSFFPVLEFANIQNAEFYKLGFTGFQQLVEGDYKTIEHAWMLSAMMAIIPIITLVTINLYKRRTIQIRLSIFNSVFMLGYYGMYFYFMYYFNGKYTCESYFQFNIITPAITIVLNYLAILGIAKDEALVKAADRIR